MTVRYVEIGEVKLYAFQYREDEDAALFDLLIPRASAIFDTLCGVSPGYFLPRSETDPATEKIFYGAGGIFLTLPPFVGEIDTLSMPSGYTVPKYASNGDSLFITDSTGVVVPTGSSEVWPRGVQVTVKAKWGFKETPDDVKEAVSELVVAMWRSKDTAFLKQIDLENQRTVNQALPPRAKMIIEQYRIVPWGAAFV